MLHTIQNHALSVTVSERGAELQSILAADGTEYLWQGDPKYWGARAINIFPYIARLTEGKYRYNGQIYEMFIHGFAPYSHFALISQNEDSLCFELTDSEATRKPYPFAFSFRVAYRLAGSTLEITYEVENRDSKTMYFGLGGHPGFQVPLAKDKCFEDYHLRFDPPCQPSRVGFTDACFRDGSEAPYPLEDDQRLPLRHDLFDHDAIVLKNMSRQVTLECSGDPRSVTVSFPQMDYVGFWHMPKSDAPFVCIEPWCSLPSKQDEITCFEEQEDLLRLEPGETYRNNWSISVNGI